MAHSDPETAALLALSPLDGRYAAKVAALAAHFSEYGADPRPRARRDRVARSAAAKSRRGRGAAVRPASARRFAPRPARPSPPADAARVKAIERTTNHDVKAVEYWLKERFAGMPEVARVAEFIHFACTSEDINNLAHGLMLGGARREILLPALGRVAAALRAMAHAHADLPMLVAHARPAGDADDARQGDSPTWSRGWTARATRSSGCR